MIVRTNTASFNKEMNNIVQYAFGFLDGVQKGKKVFLQNLGVGTIQAMAQYVDVSARGNPAALHHVYEWSQTGSPSARLFDINYTVSNLGLSINSTFRQSRTVRQDSHTPFYNKAKIMEEGIPVTIKPKRSSVLVFTEEGETVFTKSPIEEIEFKVHLKEQWMSLFLGILSNHFYVPAEYMIILINQRYLKRILKQDLKLVNQKE